MKNNQLLLIIGGVLATAGIFYFGNTVKPKAPSTEQQAAEQHSPDDGHNHSNMTSFADIVPAKAEDLSASYIKKLKPAVAEKVNTLLQSLASASKGSEKAELMDQIGRIWHDQKNRLLASYYIGNSGLLDNSEKKLTFASHLISEDINAENDPGIRKMMFDLGMRCYDQLIALQPQNDDIKVDQALLVIDGSGEVMEGVGSLLALAEEKPNNKRVQMVLGRMAIQSKQLDKALERADNILKMDPKSLEAYLLKSQAYEMKGDLTKVREVMLEAKAMMNNPEFSKDVDNYLTELEQVKQ